jgi:2-methylcitrate dehydratase PrpD
MAQGKRVLLDTVGAMVRAASPKYSAGSILAKVTRRLGGRPESSIIGQGFKTGLLEAALVNGTLGYYCDVESHHAESITHVAAVIVPTALAVAEAFGLGGRDLLRALVVGYDVETRVADALGPEALYIRGFHPSAVAGAFGAAACAGSLLHLTPSHQSMAFGLAGCQASGLLAWTTDQSENSRPFQMGVAARNGLTAALLAREGFGAPPDIFEGKNGMFGAFTDAPEPGRLVEGLRRRHTIMEAAFKRYSSCSFTHPGADALASIMSEHTLDHKDISTIELRFPAPGAPIIDNNPLKSHNAQYILPVLAVRGEVTIDDILGERRSNPEISRLSRGTSLIHDRRLASLFPSSYASIVTVGLRDGRRFSERVDHARGTPENPMDESEIEAKFRRLTRTELSEQAQEKVISVVRSIERAGSVDSLMKLVS